MTKRKLFTAAVFAAALALTAALSVFAGGGHITASASETVVPAPLAYAYREAVGSAPAHYEVTGVDDAAAAELTDAEKKNLTVIIPAVYNDGEHGEAPVTKIASHAFRKGSASGTIYNEAYDFVAVNLRGADNLAWIGVSAFANSSAAGELYIPKNVSAIESSAFMSTKFTSLVFDEEIGRVSIVGAFYDIRTTASATIHIPANFVGTISGNEDPANLFFSMAAAGFTVDENNPRYYARDGLLYQKNADGTQRYLIATPSAKEGVFTIEPGTTEISDRAFEGGKGTVIVPDSVRRFDEFSVYKFIGTVLFETTDISDLELFGSANYANTAFGRNNTLVFANKALRDAAIAEGGFLFDAVTESANRLTADNVLYLTGISAAAKSGAQFDTAMTAGQIEQRLAFTLEAGTGAQGSEKTFGLTGYGKAALPAGGLAAGENAIPVSYGGVTGSVTIRAAAPVLKSIEAVYTPGGAVYASASPGTLKNRVAVTGTSTLDSDMGAIDDFTLSGTLRPGDCELTVQAGGVTTTVTITDVQAVAVKTVTAEWKAPAGIKIVEGMTVDHIKTYITASAVNNDGSKADASGAVISIEGGALKAGANNVTVTVGGKTVTLVVEAESKTGGGAALPKNNGLSGGAIAGIVIAVVFAALILALLALFLFRKDKTIGFKDFYQALWNRCVTFVKGIFKKDTRS